MKPVLCLLFWFSTAALASADDWPQWMGPGRDNTWREAGVLENFPKGGPPVV